MVPQSPRVGIAEAMSAGSSTDPRSPAAQYWLPPESAQERRLTQELQRSSTGAAGWLETARQRLRDRWDAVWAGTWAPQAQTSAQPSGAGGSDTWWGWTRRSAVAAREWIQALDTTPMVGDAKHLWFCHGRPVVATSPGLALSHAAWRSTHPKQIINS